MLTSSVRMPWKCCILIAIEIVSMIANYIMSTSSSRRRRSCRTGSQPNQTSLLIARCSRMGSRLLQLPQQLLVALVAPVGSRLPDHCRVLPLLHLSRMICPCCGLVVQCLPHLSHQPRPQARYCLQHPHANLAWRAGVGHPATGQRSFRHCLSDGSKLLHPK